SATVATTTNTIPTPTYSSTNNGEVVISYPSGCGSTYTCTYIKDGGSPVTVTSNPTIYFGLNGTLIAKVSDGTNTVTASTYSVVRNDLYVSSAGNDTSGYGTINKPYATIQKAYDFANTTATIKVMNDLDITLPIKFNAIKNITLTSYSDKVNSIIIKSTTTDYMINHTAGSLTLKNIIFDGNHIELNGALLSTTSKLYIEKGAVLKNAHNSNSSYLGGVLRVAPGGEATMDDGLISDNSANAGGAINIGGIFTMNGGSITNNSSVRYGGAIWCGGTFIMNDGVIDSNTSTTSGGAIYASYNTSFNSFANLELNGGTISNNKSLSSDGGAIAVEGTADLSPTVTIDGTNIIKNTASAYGGGIMVAAYSNLIIKSGTISNNKALNNSGGGIHSNGIVNIISGTISNNTANQYGGGLYCGNICNMTGGIISSNISTTQYGGGVLVDGQKSAQFTLNGGTIKNNTAKLGGGGIGGSGTYTYKKGTVCNNKPSNNYETSTTCP
ncbi:MAG: hypothetical protein V8R01_03860, partial [Bacilli bacterium]